MRPSFLQGQAKKENELLRGDAEIRPFIVLSSKGTVGFPFTGTVYNQGDFFKFIFSKALKCIFAARLDGKAPLQQILLQRSILL